MTASAPIPGLWPSPVTAKSLAAALRLSDPCWDTDGETLAWIEGRSDRGVIVVQAGDDAPRDLTSDISVRAFVGYGGGDFTLAHGVAYFVGQEDQRLYRQDLTGGAARPITPAFGATSTPRVSPDGRWVAYVHTYENVDAIAIVDSDGKRWPVRVGEGRDFYMQPAWHPGSDRLAWIEWDHPNMPWDATELRIASLAFPEGASPVVAGSEVIAGGDGVAIFQPGFTADGLAALYISDETGWGHLYRRDLASGKVTQLTSGATEHARPAWNHGARTYSVSGNGTIYAVRSSGGFHNLIAISLSGDVRDLRDVHGYHTDLGYPTASPIDERIACVAASGTMPPRLVVFNTGAKGYRTSVRRRSAGETVPREQLSTPQPISWKSFDDQEAHGIFYPPVDRPDAGETRPPLIVLVHGGPTSQVEATWSPQAQYFATRGYAVLYPNYRGSTGYGREYMLKLRENWGIYDVQDAKFGAQHLADRGLVDNDRLVIMGGSAGGYTVLQSLVEVPGFYKAGINMFGVSNMFTLASDTHKFEERYLDSMLGPLPEAAALYRERSPIFHADKIVDPVAVFQGDIDRVVPREQSDSIVASLKARGVPHVYHVYEGEGHGWRKSETIEAFYKHLDDFLKQYVLFA